MIARKWAYISLAVANWGKPVLRFLLGAHWIVLVAGGAEDDDGGDCRHDFFAGWMAYCCWLLLSNEDTEFLVVEDHKEELPRKIAKPKRSRAAAIVLWD